MQDIIIKEIEINASKEAVYSAITDPQQIVTWFPEAIEEGDLSVGQQPLFIFNEGKHKSRIYVIDAKPHSYFAYRWVPGTVGTVEDVLTVPNTLVEFVLEEIENGTKVTVRESGFASLPTDIAEKSLKQNTGGWNFMINRLKNLFI